MKRVLFSFFSVFSYALLYTHTTFAVLTTLLFAHLHWKRMLRLSVQLWAKGCFWIIAKKVHIIGFENYDKNDKYILLVNHTSIFDIMAIMSLFPDICWFGREDLLKIPLFGKILLMLDYIPMKKGDLKNTKNMLSSLIEKSGNKSVAIFPEGTRTLNGSLGRFHKGFLHVQKATKRILLPVTLKGFFQLKPKLHFYIDYSASLEIHIHKPIKNNELNNLKDSEIIENVKKIMSSKLI